MFVKNSFTNLELATLLSRCHGTQGENATIVFSVSRNHRVLVFYSLLRWFLPCVSGAIPENLRLTFEIEPHCTIQALVLID